MRFLSLFSGIGGFDLGLERAGWTCVGQVEIEPFCNLVLEKHWPGVLRWTDVRDVTGETIRRRCGRPDAIVGGFPCQDISCAGKGVGITGQRSGLWFDFLQLVQELRPAWVVAENVPALRTRGADVVLEGLDQSGYTPWPLVVGADDVGAPHRRKRVWIVAHRNSDAIRDEPGRGSGASRSREAEPGGDGEEGLGDARGDGGGTEKQGRGSPGRSQTVADGDPEGERRQGEGYGRDSGPRAGCDGPRWPARPGEPQHEWEEPRLSELPLGGPVDGIPSRLVRRANREALRAYGNAVVPQVAEVIGRAILRVADVAA